MVDLIIIGKNGQLGSSFVSEAKKRKINFKAFSSSELDVTSDKSLKKIIKTNPKIIINTSAYHVLAECERYPQKAFLVNSIAVRNLAKISKSINAKFVTYSTNYVFDGKKRSPYLETDRPNPLQIYGLSKLAGEYAAINENELGTFVIRSCGVYGKGNKGSRRKRGNFILKILREATEKKVIVASDKQIVNPTNAYDLASSTLDLLTTKVPPGVYHLANEGACSWYDFAKTIIAHKKIKARVIADKNEKNDLQRPLYTVLGNFEAKKLGIVLPKINDGLERYLSTL